MMEGLVGDRDLRPRIGNVHVHERVHPLDGVEGRLAAEVAAEQAEVGLRVVRLRTVVIQEVVLDRGGDGQG